MRKLFKNQKLYIRISIVLSLFLIIIIAPITIFLSNQFSAYANQEISRFTQENTYQAKERVNHLLDRLKYFSFSVYTDERIQNYLSLGKIDPSVNRDVQVALTNYLLNEPFVDSAYVINPQNETIFSSKEGPMVFENFSDTELLSKLENDEEILQYFIHERNGTSFLGLIVTTKFDFEGNLVVLFDISKLSEFLLQTNHSLDINVMLINHEEELLLGETKDFFLHIKDDLVNHHDNEGSFQLLIDQEEWLVNYASLDTYDSKIYTLTKRSSWNKDLTNYKKKIIVLMLILITLLFLIVLWGTYRTYQPFNQLSEYFKNKFDKSISKNTDEPDYTFIKRGIDLLEDNVKKMNISYKENKELIKSEYLRQWILQEKYSESYVDNIKEEFAIFEYQYVYLAVARIESYQKFVDQYNYASRKTLKYAIGKIIEEVIEGQYYRCTIEKVDFSGDHTVLIIMADTPLGKQQLNQLLYGKEQIKKYMDLKVTIAVSRPLNLDDEIRSVYNRIYEMSNIKFLTGEEQIYQEKDYNYFQKILNSDADGFSVEKLIKAVSLGREDQMKQILEEIVEQLKKFSYKECTFQLSIIMYRLFRAFNQPTSLAEFHGIQEQLGKFETIHEVHHWLEAELLHIIRIHKKSENSDRKLELANEVKEFINVHLHDPLLSIDMIADDLSLSVSYTRQVYKEVFNQTINDYILRKRMEDVLELLRTKDWNINDIFEYCGFQTKSNFYTVFKKVVGMTPSEYRNKHRKI